MRVERLVTLNEAAMEAKMQGADIDVLDLIHGIPSLVIVHGEGVSVHIALDEEDLPLLLECAAEHCVVDEYAGLEPMPEPREFYE